MSRKKKTVLSDPCEKNKHSRKIQNLFINELFKEGHVELTLPTGMTIEVGVTQENRNGDLRIQDDYCWVIASQEDRSVSIDPYTFGLRFSEDPDRMIYSEDIINYEGEQMRIFEVI
jgi:hypothetical protein